MWGLIFKGENPYVVDLIKSTINIGMLSDAFEMILLKLGVMIDITKPTAGC